MISLNGNLVSSPTVAKSSKQSAILQHAFGWEFVFTFLSFSPISDCTPPFNVHIHFNNNDDSTANAARNDGIVNAKQSRLVWNTNKNKTFVQDLGPINTPQNFPRYQTKCYSLWKSIIFSTKYQIWMIYFLSSIPDNFLGLNAWLEKSTISRNPTQSVWLYSTTAIIAQNQHFSSFFFRGLCLEYEQKRCWARLPMSPLL